MQSGLPVAGAHFRIGTYLKIRDAGQPDAQEFMQRFNSPLADGDGRIDLPNGPIHNARRINRLMIRTGVQACQKGRL